MSVKLSCLICVRQYIKHPHTFSALMWAHVLHMFSRLVLLKSRLPTEKHLLILCLCEYTRAACACIYVLCAHLPICPSVRKIYLRLIWLQMQELPKRNGIEHSKNSKANLWLSQSHKYFISHTRRLLPFECQFRRQIHQWTMLFVRCCWPNLIQ